MAVFSLASACVYDPDDRCGEHQVIIDNDRCACEAGYVPGDTGCVACAEHEQEVGGACVCVAGYARATEAVACEVIPGGLGVACDTESQACPAGDYETCHLVEGTVGYCTATGCETSEDCESGYMCQRSTEGNYCRRPPTGYGDPCESDGDCAAGEATFCETLQSNQCLVACSATNADVCFEGEVCCDFVFFSPICVPKDACTAPGSVLGPT